MKKVLLSLAAILLLAAPAFSVTLSGVTDNLVSINPNTPVTVTSDIASATWIIQPVSDCYFNVWGNTATTSSRKLYAKPAVYEIRMTNGQFSILGTATENITILLKKSTDARDIIGRGLDSNLSTIAGLTPADNSFIVGNGTAWTAETPAQARSSLGLGDMALQASNNVTILGGSITGITDLAVADGGTGASTTAGARTNLGLGDMSIQSSNNVTISGGTITGITDLVVADGGTGTSSLTSGGVLFGNGTSPITASAVMTNGQLLIGDGSATPSVATLTPGSSIGITNGAGSITVTLNDTINVPIVNAVTAFTLAGSNLNTAGTLSNVAYLNQANTFTATQSISTGLLVDTNTLVVDGTNNMVGIGTVSPAYRLDISPSSGDASLYLNSTNSVASIYLDNNTAGSWQIGMSSDIGSTLLGLRESGTVVASWARSGSPEFTVLLGAATTGTALVIDGSNHIRPLSSSRRFKSNISPLSIDTSKIYLLEPEAFTYSESQTNSFGYMAEDVAQILPQLVFNDNEGRPYSVLYSHLPILMLEEMKKLKTHIDNLEARLIALENQK